MASINMVTEERATGKVKEIYEVILSQLSIDFVPSRHEQQSITKSFPICWGD